MNNENFERILTELQTGERSLNAICNRDNRLRVSFIREAKRRKIDLPNRRRNNDQPAPPTELPQEYLEMEADELLQVIEKQLLQNIAKNPNDKFWAGMGAKLVQLSQTRYCAKEKMTGINESEITRLWESWAGERNAKAEEKAEAEKQ